MVCWSAGQTCVRDRPSQLVPHFDSRRSKPEELGYRRPSEDKKGCHTVVAKEGVRASVRLTGVHGPEWRQMLFRACAKRFSDQFEAF